MLSMGGRDLVRNTKCILILGSHRSGTSLLSGILKIAGIDFGKNLLGPSKDNPKGFFENINIVNRNIKFLTDLGSDSDITKPLPTDWQLKTELISEFRKDLKEIIIKDFEIGPNFKKDAEIIFAIKDPRISIFLPVYLDVFRELNIDLVFLVTKRNRFEIANSLLKRNGYSISTGIKMVDYFENSIDFYLKDFSGLSYSDPTSTGSVFLNSRSLGSRLDISMNDLIFNTEKTYQKIRHKLPMVKSFEEIKGQISDFIDPSLKHFSVDEFKVIDSLAEIIDSKDRLLDSLNQNYQNYRNLNNDLKKENNRLKGEVLSLSKDLVRTTGTINSLNLSKNDLEHTVYRQKEVIKEKDGDLDNLRVTHEDLRIRILEYEEKINNLLGESDYQKNSLEKIEIAYQDIHDENIKISQENAELKKSVNDLNIELNHLHEQILSKNKKIDSLEFESVEIKKSLMWNLRQFYFSVLDKVLPVNTKLRRVYSRLILWLQKVLLQKIPRNYFAIKRKIFKKKQKDAKRFLNRFYKDVDVLFINHDESRTGAPRIVFEVAKFLKKDLNVAMVSISRGSMHKDFLNEFKKIIYPNEIYPKLDKFEIAENILSEIKPKVVYANSLDSYPYAKVARQMGIKVIFHVHELREAFNVVFKPEELVEFRDYADLYIAVSKPVEDLLINDLGCDSQKIRLINAFVSNREISKKSQEISCKAVESELGLEKASILIMGLGHFNKRKGADIFMKTSEQFKDRTDLKFIWIGSIPNQNEEFLKDLSKYNKYFTLLSEKENPFPYLKRADIFVLTSREDPFPLVIMEAMSLAKPTILYKDSGGSPDVVKDSGLIIKDIEVGGFVAAIKRLVDNQNLRKMLGNKAIKYQRKIDAELVLPQIADLIKSIYDFRK